MKMIFKRYSFCALAQSVPRGPDRPTAESARLLRKLLGLLELLQHAIALQAREVVDVEHAIEMIELVLHTDGEAVLGIAGDALALKVGVFYRHFGRALDVVVDLRDREASFLGGD